MAIPKREIFETGDLPLGKIAENDPRTHIITKRAETVIDFGRAVAPGTAGDQVKAPDGTAFRGIATNSTDASNLDTEKYAIDDPVGVAEQGVFSVKVESAIALGDDVRFRKSGVGTLGDFTKTATAGETIQITKGARWKSVDKKGKANLYISFDNIELSADV